MTDPISDILSQIRNAILAGHDEIISPYSNLREQVAKVLVKSGFLINCQARTQDKRQKLLITIATPTSPPKITELTRVSRPGRRHYVKAAAIPKVKGGRGMVIMSTSRGIMAGDEATKKKLGGEIICEVY